MKKSYKVRAAALNIKTLSHNDKATYVRLMQRAFDLRLPVKLRGDRHALLLSFGRVTSGQSEGQYAGNIATFIRLELNAPWINTERLEPASLDELRSISIPEFLAPNYKIIPFYFDPATHILVFETFNGGHLTAPMPMKEYFEHLLSAPTILEEFSTVEVILIQSAETITEILALDVLQTLDIYITIPNPLGPREEAFVRELENQKASATAIHYKHKRGVSLDPNAATKVAMNVALANGEVNGTGTNVNGTHVTLSTQAKPEIKEGSYPAESSHNEALEVLTKTFANERLELPSESTRLNVPAVTTNNITEEPRELA